MAYTKTSGGPFWNRLSGMEQHYFRTGRLREMTNADRQKLREAGYDVGDERKLVPTDFMKKLNGSPTRRGEGGSPQFETPDFSSQFEEQIDAQNEMWREVQKQREQQQREAERRAAQKEIDQLLAARSEAENAAVKTVDEQLTQNMDRARLLGLDFQVPDEQRLLRISNTFSELFPEEQDTRLVELMSKYGSPDMSTAERQAIEAGDLRFMPEFAIQRTDREGDASIDEALAAGGKSPAGGRRGKRFNLLDEEDDRPNILGI